MRVSIGFYNVPEFLKDLNSWTSSFEISDQDLEEATLDAPGVLRLVVGEAQKAISTEILKATIEGRDDT